MSDRGGTTIERITMIVLISLMVHAVVVVGWARWGPRWKLHEYEAPVSVQLIGESDIHSDEIPDSSSELVTPPADVEPEPEVDVPEDKKLPDGQIVETPAPTEDKTPLQADYLAEHDNAVQEESRTDKFRVNPDILANQYSDQSKLELNDALDLSANSPSTGATAGGIDEMEIGKGAPRSSIPSEFAFTNKEGLASPVAASSSKQSIAGAPQNDLLDEKRAAVVALNTRAFIGAEYMNRIRRQVNLYWQQNLDNLSPSLRLTKSRYVTVVAAVLTSEGGLETIEVTDESGSAAMDDCVTNAFRIAAPFPNPPAQLIQRDGRVYLDNFEFTVNLGQATMRYSGVDPRAGVQFPGILTAPH